MTTKDTQTQKPINLKGLFHCYNYPTISQFPTHLSFMLCLSPCELRALLLQTRDARKRNSHSNLFPQLLHVWAFSHSLLWFVLIPQQSSYLPTIFPR